MYLNTSTKEKHAKNTDVRDTYLVSMIYLVNSCFSSGLLRKAFLDSSPLLSFSGFLSKAVALFILFSAKFHIAKNNSLILEWLNSREDWQNGVLQNLNPANFDVPNLF